MHTHSDDSEMSLRLKQLLALKRHEQPPPGFFNDFSARVIDRLRTPELLPQPTWWERLGFGLNLRPALVCGLGVVISSLLFFGAITAVPTEGPVMAGVQPIGALEIAWMPPMVASVALRPISSFDDLPASTSPVFGAPASSPFSHLSVQAARVNWAFGSAQN